MAVKEEGLKRYVGVLGLTVNIINIIIGAGIFVIPALVAENMGATSIVAYLFCGFLISLIMLCFAEAGSKITDSGGGYAYGEAAFGKYPGFLMAVISLAATLLADAVVANALVDIIGTSFPIFKTELVRVGFFIILFYGLAIINIIGIKQGIGLVKIITFLKLIPLFLLITIGWKDVEFSNLVWESSPTIKQIGETTIILIFAFQGGDVGLMIGGEIKNPKKTIPKSIFIAIFVVLLFYMLIQGVSQGVLGDELVNFKKDPLAQTANIIFGPIGYTILFIGAAISMFGNLTGEILNNPRMLFATARKNVIPIKKLALIHPNYKTPYVSILIYASIGFLLATFGGFEKLISVASSAALLYYLGVVLSVIQLRRIRKTEPDEFEIPGGYTVPILSIIIILYLLSTLTRYEKIGMVIFIGVLSIIYFGIIFLRKSKKIESNYD